MNARTRIAGLAVLVLRSRDSSLRLDRLLTEVAAVRGSSESMDRRVEDLRRSGLDDATIAAAGLYTPAPGDLPRLLGARLTDQVRNALVFSYDGVSHGGVWSAPVR